MKKQPLYTNSKNGVQLAVFEHTSPQGARWFSTSIKRPYKDASGAWQQGSYRREQLAAVKELVQEAIEFVDRQSSEAAAAN